MGQCFSLKSEELSTFNKTRIHLPIRLGGLGVRELSHVRHAEFIGGVMDGIPPLLPQHHDDGELHGKLNKLYVEHWIGENCLMSEHGPWSKIISRNESALGYGINLAFTLMCNEYHTMIPDHENNLSSSDLLHNDSSFAGFTLNGEIKQGSITQCLSKDLEDATKEHLDRVYILNEDGHFHHNMERLSWYNTDEISIQCLRALPNRDGILKNDIFIEAVRCILGLPSHILQPFADGHHFVGRNATVVDAHGIMVKNAMLINGDYHRMHASIQSLIIDMFKKAKIWAIREPQNMFHGLVPADILKQYCDQHSIKEFIIPDIMTYDHPHRERSGRVILQRRIFEVKTMRVDSRMSKYNPRNPSRRAVDKRVAEIEAHYTKRAKKLDATFAAGNNSNPFLSAYKSYGINGIDSLVVGHFGEVNKGFKQLICSLAKVAAESQEAGNTTPASSTDHKRKGAYALFKKRFKVALGCMAIRTQTELMIRRVQFIRRTKEAATQAACAGNSRGYHSEYGNSWFNNRENDDAYYMFRSYNNCYYSSSEPVTDEEDEL